MKKAYFYIDDTIWVLRDITKQKPKSIFDNEFMKMLKTAHDKYGLKVQLNLFFRTSSFYENEEFSLSDMTDAYKEEFSANSSWIKFAFHAKEEFPDFPHINATYKDIYDLFKSIEKEVFRFAGEASFSYVVCPHWLPVSKEGIRALKDCGVKIVDTTKGDAVEYEAEKTILPYGHDLRLLHNRQKETRVYRFGDCGADYSLCGYNHFSTELHNETAKNCKLVWDDEIGIYFKKYVSICLNRVDYDALDGKFENLIDNEYVGICDHEQYFYSDYFAYQPDYADKIYKMCETLTSNGFTFIEGIELLEK